MIKSDFELITTMIGKDEGQEEVTFKVADRRKFNADGSLKEGVTLEQAKTEDKPKPASPPERRPEPAEQEAQLPDAEMDEDLDDETDIPGIDDPASFVNFLSTLATNAAAALGAVPHPATGQRSLDLDSAKYWLDILGMLRAKTKGNLHPKENRLLESVLGDMRMQYVHYVRATEEKLKAQAAQKFSNADILGKK